MDKKDKKNKKDTKNKKDKKDKKNKKVYSKQDYENAINNAFKTNYIFYFSCIICIYVLSRYDDSGFLSNIFSFILVSLLGYFAHYNSHHLYFTDFYNKLDNYITRTTVLNYIIENICIFIDFHDITHHDIEINKTPHNLLYEFILNFVTQGGVLILVVWIARHLNLYVLLLWGLMYASVHIINYSFVKPLTHQYHHVDKYTNYGIDIWDIIFGTKYNNNIDDIENINHYSFNIIIITGLIVKLFLV